mmetsp:Transcript_20678/g.30852  ORF Transcript_20678/g.30852 Transcript_20678/m.30852 type:complete len:89 (-) Transcript_20678:605-871(-)
MAHKRPLQGSRPIFDEKDGLFSLSWQPAIQAPNLPLSDINHVKCTLITVISGELINDTSIQFHPTETDIFVLIALQRTLHKLNEFNHE